MFFVREKHKLKCIIRQHPKNKEQEGIAISVVIRSFKNWVDRPQINELFQ